jgi:primosomal protein N' (replication factor Y)
MAAADWLGQLLTSQRIDDVWVVGPAPCPIDRIKRRWRWHLFLKSHRPTPLERVARYFMERFPVPAAHDLRIALDRDPVSVL